jgi:hypothetical protein
MSPHIFPLGEITSSHPVAAIVLGSLKQELPFSVTLLSIIGVCCSMRCAMVCVVTILSHEKWAECVSMGASTDNHPNY